MKYNIYEAYKPLLEDWKENIEVVKEHVEGFSDIEATQLAIVLENTKTELDIARGRLGQGMINEVTDVSMINTMTSNVFDIITAVMPNLIANDIVSVQPLDRRTGQIFYLKFKYGSDKGNVSAGENMLTPQQGFTGKDYSGEKIFQELVGERGSGAGTVTIAATLAYTPIKPGTVTITGTLENGSEATAVDNGDGEFVGDLVSAGGSINYLNGAVTGVITNNLTANTDLFADYEYDLNSPDATVSDVDVTVESLPVVARPRKLKSVYMFDTAYDLKMAFGLDMDTVIMKATSGEIGFEIDNEIMMDLLRIAPEDIEWDINPPYRGMEQQKHYQTLITAINEASNTILGNTKRYEATFIVTGKTGAIVVESMGKDRFRRTSPGGVVGGPHLCGVLDEKYRVYKNPNYDDDRILVGAKGEMFIEAGYVYAPYLPVFATQLLVDDDLKGRRGFCTVYAKKPVNPFMYCSITIVETAPTAVS